MRGKFGTKHALKKELLYVKQVCIMTIREGQALHPRIKQEDRQIRGRKPSDERKDQRCGVFDKSSHNARTYQIDVEISNEDDKL